MSKFTNGTKFKAVGRVNTGGRKIPLTVQTENDYIVHITNADGFSLRVNTGTGNRSWYASNVSCTLANGTIILCEGQIDPADGRLRLDATDQDNFYWFWVEVRSS